MTLVFTLKMFNNTNKILKFQEFISDYNNKYYINTSIIKPNHSFIIDIEIIQGSPIIADIIFNYGQLNILNQVQKHYGSSFFIFSGDNIKCKTITQQRFQPNGNLPSFSIVKIEINNN